MPSPKPVRAQTNRSQTARAETPRVAIVCDFLTDVGGAEKVVAEIASLYPEAPVFTLLHDAKKTASLVDPARVRPVKLPFFARLLRSRRRYIFPLFPRLIESIDLAGYDIVISSAHSYAKGIITKPDTLHVCYCHSPTRYLWDWKDEYLNEQKLTGLKRRIVQKLLTDLRQWDLLASERVDRFVANSQHVRHRIQKYYRRESAVIYPPIALPDIAPSRGDVGYFLIVSRLEPYKRIDLALRAFARLKDIPLVIIGTGSQEKALRAMATDNVEFLGRKDDATVRAYLQGCRGFIFPGEDDFGMAPVEAMAAGKPVVAYGKGGALETVIEGSTGTFFYEPTPKDLKEALLRLISVEKTLDPAVIRARAEQFSTAVFRRKLKAFVSQAWDEHRAANGQPS